jgi:hypothetical protein
MMSEEAGNFPQRRGDAEMAAVNSGIAVVDPIIDWFIPLPQHETLPRVPPRLL